MKKITVHEATYLPIHAHQENFPFQEGSNDNKSSGISSFFLASLHQAFSSSPAFIQDEQQVLLQHRFIFSRDKNVHLEKENETSKLLQRWQHLNPPKNSILPGQFNDALFSSPILGTFKGKRAPIIYEETHQRDH